LLVQTLKNPKIDFLGPKTAKLRKIRLDFATVIEGMQVRPQFLAPAFRG
jgi:hypothetical protein